MVSTILRRGTRKRVVARLLATAMVGAALAAAPVVVPDVAPSAVAATGGPVVLDGMDPVCHSFYENTDGYIEAVLAGLHTNVTRTNDASIAVLGVSAETGSCGGTFGSAMAEFVSAISPTPTVNYYADDAAIDGLFDAIEDGTAKPAVLWLPDGSGADAAVSARAEDLADFVGDGGGLFSNMSGYSWLTALLPNAQFQGGGCNGGPAVTEAGKAAFPSLTDELVTACWHGSFKGDIGALQVLVDWPYPQPTDPRVGVAIGGAQVTLTPVPAATAPGAPTVTKAVAGNGKVSVTVAAPANDGGSAVTSYTVTAQPGGKTATVSGATGGTATITGLTNGVAYTFTATATNEAGTSSAGAPVKATPVTVPAAPSWKVTKTDLGSVTVAVTAPKSTGGSALRRLVLTVTGGGVKKTVVVAAKGGTAAVTGLKPGTTYTVSVVAESAAGTSAAVKRTVKTAPLPKGPVPMTKVGGSLYPGMSATLTGDGLFAYQSAKLTKKGREQAYRTAKSLSAAKAVRCEGYTDGTDNKANYDLGLARAKAVCTYLVSNGVKAKTTTVSYGAKRPVRTTGTREQRAVNRRVVVTVLK